MAPPVERAAFRLLHVLAVFFIALVVAVRPLLPGHGGESNVWVQMGIFIAAMVWLVRMAMERRLVLVHTGVALPLGILLAIAAISALRSPNRGASLTTLIEWFSYGVLFLVIANATAGSLDRRFVLRVLWASAFAVCVYGLFQHFVNLPLLREQILANREKVLLELGLRGEDYDNLVARASGRIFANFLLPNGFAGFLVLVLPGFVGYALDRVRAGDRRPPFLVASALWVAGALACLLLTFSKGGWVAFLAGAALFCAMLGKRLLRRHWKLVAAVAALFAVGVIVLVAVGVIPTRIAFDARGSMGVRVGYWRTAWAMAKDNWLTGVGLGTFPSHYHRYRWVLARVTQNAHNDYLQVLAELGVVGLAAFLATWAFILRGCVVRRREAGGREFPPRVGYVAGLVAFALSSAMLAFTVAGWGDEARFATLSKGVWDMALVAGLAACWVASFALLGRGERGEPGELCRNGLVCGLVAFLVHCTADFDYYEPGVVLTAWAIAAVAVAARRKPFEMRLRPVPAFALGAAALAAMVGFQLHLLRTVTADADQSNARARMIEAVEAHEAGRHIEAERLMARSRQLYGDALAARPLDAPLRLQYAAMLVNLLLPGYANEPLLRRTVDLYGEAAALDRASAASHVRLAELFERAADAGARAALLPYVQAYGPRHSGPAPFPIYLPAVVEYEEALRRDPLRPKLLLQLARALQKLGNAQKARELIERALELHDRLIQHHPEHVLRLKDDQLTAARALLRRVGGGGPSP